MKHDADVIVVGAGIAGISAAYHLNVRHGVDRVTIVDPRPPLTLTSDKSTEAYRNWWPSRPMVGLMNRSIDILEGLGEETDFGLNRNGYLFVTSREDQLSDWADDVNDVKELGADGVIYPGSELLGRFSFLTERAEGGLFIPRAGWLRAQDLGQWMLERARESGTTLLARTVTGIEPGSVHLDDGTRLGSDYVVIAAGPLSRPVGSLAGLDLPLHSELHLKVSFKDHLGVIPRDVPMTIWSDAQTIGWSPEEATALVEMGRTDLVEELPIFCHFRPEGGADSPYVVALWEYRHQVMEPTWPLPEDPLYPEVVMRGLTTMVPELARYHDRLPESFVDGGYYTKTAENRPLIGPSGMDGVQLITAMSGFGVMVSAGAADLLARHILGEPLPDYAEAFLLQRYEDADYMASLGEAASGQL